MTWQDINLNTATWTIPGKNAKAHRPIVVPLAGPALQILQERKRHMQSDPWVFPGTGATGHIVEPKSAWKRLLQRSGLEDLRLHDLRHSLASWQASMGVSLAIVGKALGHQTTATTARYAHLASDPVRQAMEQAAAAMMGGVNENVLPMKKAK